MTPATNNSLSSNPDALHRLREEHPRRPSYGSFLSSSPPESQPVPRFAQGNRRSSDGDDRRRSSWNRSSSFKSSLNLVEDDGETTATNTAQQQPQYTMRRVTSETALAGGSTALNGGGARSGMNPRLAQSVENGTVFSGMHRNLSDKYRPRHSSSVTSPSLNNQGDTNTNGQGNEDCGLNEVATAATVEKNYEFDDIQELGLKASQRRIITRGVATSSGSKTVDNDIANGLGEIKEGSGGGGRYNLKQTTSPGIANGIADIKLEDLVPTRRKTTSRENSAKITQEIERGDGGEAKGREKIIQDMLEGGNWGGPKENGKREASSAGSVGSPSKDTSSEKGQLKETGECISSPSPYKTANSMEASSSPSRELLQQRVDIDSDVCPRSQFGQNQQKSHSGATGQTQGTSSSSLFEAIKEEVKEIGETRRELASGDSFDMHADNVSGCPSYKNQRTSRIKKIRKTIRKSLMGANEGGDGEAMSHGGSTISAEQHQRLSRHLQRKSSARSITSAYSSFSGITGKSDATSSDKSTSRWSRFRLKGKSRSMFNLDTNDKEGSSSRQILFSKGQFTSNISNLSGHSKGSFQSSDNSFAGRCTDFYDHNDHVRAISSLVSSKSPSGRSLVTSLATVKEPAHEGLGGRGEQKHDEDYHNIRGSIDREPSAYHVYMDNCDQSNDSANSFYRYPSHEHTLVHMAPNQLFPDSPGWQCDVCLQETFDLNVWAYISTEKNYVLCESCFAKSGFSVDG